MATWTDRAWLAEAHEWIHEYVTRLGAAPVGTIDQHHIYPWSTVMRVPTGRGDLYFKASTPDLSFEARLVTLLSERRPDCIPRLLAVDLDRGWMLMSDAGERLREIVERERDLSRWLEILPLYAQVQLDLSGDVDEMLRLGVPDLRLAILPDRFEQLVDELVDLPPDLGRRLAGSVPRVRELCDELAAFGLPETIQHDDFHDGQIFVREGHYLLLDWGDSCVSHPFFTLAVTLDGQLPWGLDDVQGSVDVLPFRDAYLEPFGKVEDLAAAAEIARRLGWACRAVNAHGADSPVDTQARLRMFLDAGS
jgi:Phosphotransferase enzyme family